jgi:hypothetical protein
MSVRSWLAENPTETHFLYKSEEQKPEGPFQVLGVGPKSPQKNSSVKESLGFYKTCRPKITSSFFFFSEIRGP